MSKAGCSSQRNSHDGGPLRVPHPVRISRDCCGSPLLQPLPFWGLCGSMVVPQSVRLIAPLDTASMTSRRPPRIASTLPYLVVRLRGLDPTI